VCCSGCHRSGLGEESLLLGPLLHPAPVRSILPGHHRFADLDRLFDEYDQLFVGFARYQLQAQVAIIREDVTAIKARLSSVDQRL
jgi:hypothetical protein